MRKKWFHLFIINEQGAVSIYFILIIVPIFLFHAVLIDYARIMVAEKQAEQSLHQAMRSVLSAYDPALQRFGLFAINEHQAEDIFYEVLATNIAGSATSFVHTDVAAYELNIDPQRVLARPEVLQHQILEDMKYRAPIEIFKEVLSKFSFVSPLMKETSVFVQTVADVETNFEHREQYLDELGLLHIKLIDKMSNEIAPHVMRPVAEETAAHSSVYNIFIVVEQLPHLLPYWQVAQFTQIHAENLLQTLQVKVNESIQYVDEMQQRIDQAQALDEHILLTIQENQARAEASYDEAIQAAHPTPPALSMENNEHMQESLADSLKLFVYKEQKPSFFQDLRAYVTQTGHHLKQLRINILNMRTTLDELSRETDQISEAKLDKHAQSIFGRYLDVLQCLEIVRAYFAKERLVYTQESAQQQSEGEQEVIEASGAGWGMLSAVMTINETFDEFSEEFQVYKQLEDTFLKYKQFAINTAEAERQEIERRQVEADAEEMLPQLDFVEGVATSEASDMFSIVDRIFNGLGQILTRSRNEIYINEYIMNYFVSSEDYLSVWTSNSYLFKHREIEYILYGQHVPGLNYGLALTQLFSVRFAFNLAGALLEPYVRAASHPLLILTTALAVALKRTVQDMNELTSSNSVELIHGKTPGIKLSYMDYLRLFLFMNFGSEAKLQRIMTVLEYRQNIDLTKQGTYASGRVETEFDLWFLPQVWGVLNTTGSIRGRVHEHQYRTSKLKYISY